MTETQKEWARRLLLLALVWFAAWLLTDLTGQGLSLVLTWLLQVWLDLHGSPALFGPVWWLSSYLLIALDFFALGFGYCLLLETDWRRAGAAAWLLFAVAIPAAGFLRYGVLSHLEALVRSAFLVQLAVSCCASLAGAWYARRHRYNDKVAAIHDLIVRTVVLD